MSVDSKLGYDKAFDHVLRLRIMSILMVNPTYDFTSLKLLLQVTDGNLASHHLLHSSGQRMVSRIPELCGTMAA